MRALPLVSIAIPTYNSAVYLSDCLKSIKQQTYPKIEVLIVDSNSKDETLSLAKRYQVKVYQFNKVIKDEFESPYKRNFGARKAKGDFLYILDADMVLTNNVVKEAVELCKKNFSAVILPEDSFGEGIWASAKNLERKCYWGDDTVEAPRFFKKNVWQEIGGIDEEVGGGGDDWDLYQKLLERGYRVGRTKAIVLHNEGDLKLQNLLKKRFLYGKNTLRYLKKRPKAAMASYFPIRMAYLRNWRLFFSRPIDTAVFLVMRTMEYVAGLAGIIYSLVRI